MFVKFLRLLYLSRMSAPKLQLYFCPPRSGENQMPQGHEWNCSTCGAKNKGGTICWNCERR